MKKGSSIMSLTSRVCLSCRKHLLHLPQIPNLNSVPDGMLSVYDWKNSNHRSYMIKPMSVRRAVIVCRDPWQWKQGLSWSEVNTNRYIEAVLL